MTLCLRTVLSKISSQRKTAPARSPCIPTSASWFSSSSCSGHQLLWLNWAGKLPKQMPPHEQAAPVIPPHSAHQRLQRDDVVQIKTYLLIPKQFWFGFCLSHRPRSCFQPSPGKCSPTRCPSLSGLSACNPLLAVLCLVLICYP